jgi:hypothetical protein
MRGTMRHPKLSLFVWAGTLCAWITTAHAADSSAVTPTGSFLSAQLVGKVSHKTETVDTAVGPIEHHTSTALHEDVRLSITATVVPSIVTRVLTDSLLYRKARSELMSRYDGKVVAWKSCQHAGYTCRWLRYETSDGKRGLARFYLYDGTLVVLNAVYRDGEDIAEAFLDSAQ